MAIHIIPHATTGQTPLYADQTQDWAKQHIDDKNIECYCLDAPMWIPNGVTEFRIRNSSRNVIYTMAETTYRG